MRKGTAFTDVSEFIVKEPTLINLASTTITDTILGQTTVNTDGDIDLSGYNSFKLNWMVGSLSVSDASINIEMRLKHSNTAGSWLDVETNDIIGPVDANGNPEAITGGVYKILEEDIEAAGLYNNIYYVGYVGGKKYIRGELEVKDRVGANIIVAAWVTRMLIHTGKCDLRYPLIST